MGFGTFGGGWLTFGCRQDDTPGATVRGVAHHPYTGKEEQHAGP